VNHAAALRARVDFANDFGAADFQPRATGFADDSEWFHDSAAQTLSQQISGLAILLGRISPVPGTRKLFGGEGPTQDGSAVCWRFIASSIIPCCGTADIHGFTGRNAAGSSSCRSAARARVVMTICSVLSGFCSMM
jgi:hypothetical protein